MRTSTSAVTFGMILLIGCGTESGPTRSERSSSVAEPAPVTEPAVAAAPAVEPTSPPRPAHWPCERVLETPAGWAETVRYEYGGPTICTLPLELMLVGCPTLVHTQQPAGAGRTAITYDEQGRLVAWSVTSPGTGEVIETATVTLDERGRITRLTRQLREGARSTDYAWEDGRVNQTWGSFRIVYTLDDERRPTTHETTYLGERTESARWVYEGDRLERIEVTAEPQQVYRFSYDCGR